MTLQSGPPHGLCGGSGGGRTPGGRRGQRAWVGCLPTAPQAPVCSCHRDSTRPIPLPRAAAHNGPHPVPAPRAGRGQRLCRAEAGVQTVFVAHCGAGICLGLQIWFQGTKTCQEKVPQKMASFLPPVSETALFPDGTNPLQARGWTPASLPRLQPPCPRLLGSLELPLQSRHAQGRHVTAARMPPSDTTDGAERGEGCGGQTLGRCGGRKRRTDSSDDPASPLLSPCPGDVNTHPRKDTDTNLQSSTFIVAQRWGQPACPPTQCTAIWSERGAGQRCAPQPGGPRTRDAQRRAPGAKGHMSTVLWAGASTTANPRTQRADSWFLGAGRGQPRASSLG